MLYQIEISQGDEYTVAYVESPAYRSYPGPIPSALKRHAQLTAWGWCEAGPNMASVEVEISSYRPARVGYQANNGHAVSTPLWYFTAAPARSELEVTQ